MCRCRICDIEVSDYDMFCWTPRSRDPQPLCTDCDRDERETDDVDVSGV